MRGAEQPKTITERALEAGDGWVDAQSLPTLPSVLFRFLGLVGDPEVSTDQLSQYIWNDAALLSRALPLADVPEESGASGDSLRHSIAAIGRERIRSLAYTTPLLRSFEPFRTASYAMTLYERSLLCATASQAAALHLGLPYPERYYVAGLLHDMGYLVVLQKRPHLLPAILQQWALRPACLLEIEEELMGIDHCRLGLRMAERLGLEPWIYGAIASHHCPQPDSDWMTRLTAVGGAMANFHGVDLFPRRSLSRAVRERELQEILQGLFPESSEAGRKQLLEVLESSIRPIRDGMRETILEWQAAVASCMHPRFPKPAGSPVQFLP